MYIYIYLYIYMYAATPCYPSILAYTAVCRTYTIPSTFQLQLERYTPHGAALVTSSPGIRVRS